MAKPMQNFISRKFFGLIFQKKIIYMKQLLVIKKRTPIWKNKRTNYTRKKKCLKRITTIFIFYITKQLFHIFSRN